MTEAKKKRILTGDRPTGRLHLGHYVGSLKNRVRLQEDYDVFLIIADYHALTRKIDREHLGQVKQNVRELVLDYLSVGLEPEKVTIYRQSTVPSVTELSLILGMLLPVPYLERIPTLKEILQADHLEASSYGLLGYPVLQSADILHLKADLVPVGKDQESHIELTRELVRRFTKLFGPVFVEPQALVGDVGTLPGIDGKAKMSKSLGNDIKLADDTETVRAKVMRMYTDPSRIKPTDPGHVEGNPVFIYHDAFNANKEEVADLKDRYTKGTVGDVEVKEKLVVALESFLEPIRERRALYEAKGDAFIDELLTSGAQKVSAISLETLREVKEKMGLIG